MSTLGGRDNWIEQDGRPRLWRAITPSDTTDLTQWCRAIYIGGSGTVTLYSGDDEDVTIVTQLVFAGMVAGTIYPIAVRRIFVTGTTATNIMGCL